MMKKEIYFFNNSSSRAAVYGIGAYTNQLVKSLINTEWKLNTVNLYTQGKEMEIVEYGQYRQINIPFPNEKMQSPFQYNKCYAKIITYFLKDIIPEDGETKCVFHLNMMNNYPLISYLKKLYKHKIVLVSHYADWSFALLGDYPELKKLLNKPKNAIKTEQEKAILKSFKEDIKMINRVDRFVCVAQHTLYTYCESGRISRD